MVQEADLPKIIAYKTVSHFLTNWYLCFYNTRISCLTMSLHPVPTYNCPSFPYCRRTNTPIQTHRAPEETDGESMMGGVCMCDDVIVIGGGCLSLSAMFSSPSLLLYVSLIFTTLQSIHEMINGDHAYYSSSSMSLARVVYQFLACVLILFQFDSLSISFSLLLFFALLLSFASAPYCAFTQAPETLTHTHTHA